MFNKLKVNMEYSKQFPLLDRELGTFLQSLANSSVDLGKLSPQLFRTLMDDLSEKMKGQLVEVSKVQDVVIKTEKFNTPIRLYYPELEKKLPTVFFMHGGGWVGGNFNSHDNVCRRIAMESDSMVVAIDYSLAPEFVFPYAINQVEEVLNWFLMNGIKYGADSNNIILCGDSAGANLAAVLSHRLSNSGVLKLPKAQVLFYPVVDMLSDNKSKDLFGKGFMLDREQMIWFFDMYTDNKVEKNNSDLSPLYASINKCYPKSLIITAGHDPLRDEGIEYSNKLKQHGIDVKHTNYESMIHGFIGFEHLEQSHLAMKEACQFIKNVVAVTDDSNVITIDS